MDESQQQLAPDPSLLNNQSNLLNRHKKLFIIFSAAILIVILLGIINIVSVTVEKNTESRKNEAIKKSLTVKNSQTKEKSPNSIVYAFRSTSGVSVGLIDLTQQKEKILTELPKNIKHIRILTPSVISYIANTNSWDYGTQIVKNDTTQKKEVTLFTISDGFGIDDYRISPNGKYLAIWAVKPLPNASQLIGGESRVYSVDTTNNKQYLLYSETSSTTSPVHYPVGVTNNGEVFTDTFLPNSGVGMAYGMSYSSINGEVKTPIQSLENGTYGTQPEMSKDGRYFVFAGYDGSIGNGAEAVGAYRKVILSTNTLDVLDTATREKIRLLNVAPDSITDAQWDSLSGNIIYKKISTQQEKTGRYLFDLATKTSKKIDVSKMVAPVALDDKAYVIEGTDSTQTFITRKTPTNTYINNLGADYTLLAEKLYFYDKKTNNIKIFPLSVPSYFQILGFTKENLLGSQVSKNRIAELNEKNYALSLQAIVIEPKLGPIREDRQSELPPNPQPTLAPQTGTGNFCMDEAIAGCNYHFTGDSTKPPDPMTAAYGTCLQEAYDSANICYECLERAGLLSTSSTRSSSNNLVANGTGDACYDSPLYLYGQQGKNVTIRFGTPIYPINASVLPEKGLNAKLLTNGDFLVDDKVLSGFEFDYLPALRTIQKPTHGVLIPGNMLEETLKSFGLSIGLNKKEILDLVSSTAKIKSPYLFVSFYSDELSKQILPISFTPHPDTYKNIVFYIKKYSSQPSIKPKAPVFEKIIRKGFTAIEVSFVEE
ncbi:MAG: hypothetical protein KBC00_01315 [Candidatus Levybacteria bacterium]|nr:hypothetical protein [Candidatus Levybacteria bacterium]MBP9814975.1 hypothetical protein [Candidatus Levybacteria bacterium]